MIRFVFALMASTLVVTPIAVGAADLTIWWSKGYYPSEDEGLRRVVAGFEDETQTKVDLTFVSMPDLATKTLAALESGEPPDIDFLLSEQMRRWAFDGALLNLDDVVGPITADLDPTVRELALMENGRAGGQGYYRIPIGLATVHIHVWQSLLDQAGIPPSAIPGEWDAFWDFWCDQVQPAVRRLPGHEKAYGVGLTLSTSSQSDALNQIVMFLLAHDAYFMSPDGRLLFDEPGMRGRIVKALESFTAPAKKGCVPPGAMNWTDTDNNANFLNQTVVMVANASLSIPASQRETNPENYYKNIATIPWPKAVDGGPLTQLGGSIYALSFTASPNPEGAKAFLRYLLQPEQLGPYLEATQGRFFPPMPRLLERPFWQSSSDPHVAALARQLAGSEKRFVPSAYNWKYQKAEAERVWPKAVARIVIDGWSAEAAIDEAIARSKQIMSE
jgi:multiple sugar transport system substrate-binding protein